MADCVQILALDDDPAMQALFSIAFRNSDVDLAFAADEIEAQQQLEKHSFDLFLVDYQLNGKDGLKVAEELLNHASVLIPIILVTAGQVDGSAHATLSSHYAGCISKPICLYTFGAEVLRYLSASGGNISPKACGRAASSPIEDLGPLFLERALIQSRILLQRLDADLPQNELLAQAAHRWAGTSAIGCLPRVDIEARKLEKLALSGKIEQLPEMQRLLTEIVGKFETALSSVIALQSSRSAFETKQINDK